MTASPLVIRLFSDHVGSPLWLTGYGNIDPETLKLDAHLCRRLHEWANYFSQNFGFVVSKVTWIDGADGDRYDFEGVELARELSRKLGHDFVVEFWSMKGDPPGRRVTLRGRHEGRVPGATSIASELIRGEDR